jgi:hypothetical protein
MADPKPRDPKLPVGSAYCQCAVCLEYFNSDAAFTLHRKGDVDERYCLTDEAMLARGMAQNDRGYWVTHKMQEGAYASR